MKLRDYINNSYIQQDYERTRDIDKLSQEIVNLLKINKSEEARELLDKNIEQLYKDLDIDSFCCLINYYINNISLEEKNLSVLNKPEIPKLLINLYKDNDEKNKIYFINKLNQYNESESWEYVLQCIDILISKTDVDKLEMNMLKLNQLVKLERYEDALKECNKLLCGEFKTNEEINKIKLNSLVETKQFDELEKYLSIAEYILDKETTSKGYIALAKYYESIKNNDKAYKLYNKASELDSNYKIPVIITYKTKGIEGTKLEKFINKIKPTIDFIKENKKIKIAILIGILLIAIVPIAKGKLNKSQENKKISEVIDTDESEKVDTKQTETNKDSDKIIVTEENLDELELELVLTDNMNQEILKKIDYIDGVLKAPKNIRVDFKIIDRITGKEVDQDYISLSNEGNVCTFGRDPNIYIETINSGNSYLDIRLDSNFEVILSIDICVYPETNTYNYDLNEEEKHELIRERMSSFEPAFAKAVNAGDIGLLEDNLLEEAYDTYDKFKSIVEDYYSRNIKVISYDHYVTNISDQGNNEYKINIYEKWGIIKDGVEEIREYDSIYLLKIQGNECYIKEQIR